MRYLAALALLSLSFAAGATSTVSGQWEVTLLRGTTSSPPVSTGATADAAWAACLSRIPVPAPLTNQTSGTGNYTCQTPRYKAVVAYSPNPPAPVNCVVSAWGACQLSEWSACAEGSQTQRETCTRTVVTQPANGGSACPALVETRISSRPCTVIGTASLSWTPPTQNTDGTTAVLTGYRIHYGRSASELVNAIEVIGVSSYVVRDLPAGTYYFAVRAVASSGASGLSNVAQKTVQ